jgi:hypothetical protein
MTTGLLRSTAKKGQKSELAVKSLPRDTTGFFGIDMPVRLVAA